MVMPEASSSRRCSTGWRRPRTVGCPWQIDGSEVIRSRRDIAVSVPSTDCSGAVRNELVWIGTLLSRTGPSSVSPHRRPEVVVAIDSGEVLTGRLLRAGDRGPRTEDGGLAERVGSRTRGPARRLRAGESDRLPRHHPGRARSLTTWCGAGSPCPPPRAGPAGRSASRCGPARRRPRRGSKRRSGWFCSPLAVSVAPAHRSGQRSSIRCRTAATLVA